MFFPFLAATIVGAGAVKLGAMSTMVSVLSLALQGLPSKLIARQLSLSHRTVEHHRSRLLEKLGVGSMAELLRLNHRQLLEGRHPPPPGST